MLIFNLFKVIYIGIVCFIVVVGPFIYSYVNPNYTLDKNKILNTYSSIINYFSSKTLTADSKLVGKRKYGIDHYVGKYTANYINYSGEEVVFGGTVLNRKESDHINIKVKLNKVSGDIKVINQIGNECITILDDTGQYDNTMYIDGMSYYFKIYLDNFKGNIEVEIT